MDLVDGSGCESALLMGAVQISQHLRIDVGDRHVFEHWLDVALVGVPVADHSPHRREGDHGQDGGGSDETVSDGWGLDAPAGDRGAAQRDICRVSR